MSQCTNDRWSNFDRFSTSTSRYPMRTKSPYRSNSSLSRTSSTSNLKIEDDYFNALNKSLGAHDADFMHKEEEDINEPSSNSEWRYNSLNRPRSKFNTDRLKKDYSRSSYDKYGTGSYGLGDYKSPSSYGYSYDSNNYSSRKPTSTSNPSTNSNTYSNYFSKSKVTYAGSDSEPEYETYTYSSKPDRLGGPNIRKSTYSSGKGYSSRPSYNRSYGGDDDDNQSLESDASMSEYINCGSFYPDTLSDQKLFVS
ncbi:hypothetical protein QR98_0048890 [Sarcoptes scabiei]|uniref:Uncharacterized protein n=1 Tax=Sarcoptes scabiei TaxID=52283 RepID=A0A132A650_SARSC|nr:hypothetical protein QR98_0048890 [Sarcoptes scabiei]